MELCQICHGDNGGEVVICDDCHAAIAPVVADALRKDEEIARLKKEVERWKMEAYDHGYQP